MKKAIVLLLVLSLVLSLITLPAFADATDTKPPELVKAFAVKNNFIDGENMQLVLKFIEPGGMKLDGIYLYLALVGSETPNSTNVYSGWISDFKFTNATSTYCTQQEISNGYYAVLVSCPVSNGTRDYFMSGTYQLASLVAIDKANNYSFYGEITNWGGGGSPVPE